MKKKLVSVILASAMATSMLAGCGSSAAPAASEAAPAASEAAPAASEAAPAASEAAPAATEAASEAAATEAASEAATEAAGSITRAVAEAVPDSIEADSSLADKKVGVCIYQFSDNFMTLFREKMEEYLISMGFSKDNITFADGANDQGTQSGQIDNFIADKVDVLIINPVNSSSAATITDKVTAAGIPLVYINREPDAAEEQRWADQGMNVTYVGCDARQSGTMQGEIIADLGLDKIDFNSNGKVDYIMIEGDPENVDAQYRTEFSIKALEDAGLQVECLDDEVGNWDQATAQGLVANALAAHPETEVVFCNNDAMGLGALQAIEAAGRTVNKDIYLVGVDALTEALEDIKADKFTGTVFNDHLAQAYNSALAAKNFINGTGNSQYIGCDYVKVTTDNVDDIMAKLK